MRWIVTYSTRSDPEAIENALREAGAHRDLREDAVPLDDQETSIVVEGPRDLPERLGNRQGIKGVFPSSEMTLY